VFRGVPRVPISPGVRVEDAGLVSAAGHLDQRAAAGQFDIIGMRGYASTSSFICAPWRADSSSLILLDTASHPTIASCN